MTDNLRENLQAHTYVESSGNVFADMGLDNAEELLIRAQLGHSIRQILKSRNLKQTEIATLLNLEQAQVSHLMQSQYHLFSEDHLLELLNQLEQPVASR
jgi:predicted XRE-type DNA-binding protein